MNINQYLLDNAEKLPIKLLALELKLPDSYLRDLCKKLGVKAKPIRIYNEDFIKANIDKYTIEEMSFLLGITVGTLEVEYFRPLHIRPSKKPPQTVDIKDKTILPKKLYEDPEFRKQATGIVANLIREMDRANGIKPVRPKAVYTQCGSPFGIADELHRITKVR